MASFLFASDSFKGSLSSSRIAEMLGEELSRALPGSPSRSTPMADGGEGTVETVVSTTGGKTVYVRVQGPLGTPAVATYGLLAGGRAVIEMASASGLPMVAAGDRNPLLTSTFGTGQLIADALDRGARDISVAIGGSATNDGGMGAMRALGVRFLDVRGDELEGWGADLGLVSSIDLSHLDPRVAGTAFHVMCDVDNPLTGERGATLVFAPQKGADWRMAQDLERGMRSYARVLEGTFGFDVASMAGSGAAGGLGAALRAFLGAELLPGIECVLDLVGFDEMLDGVDVCVTGEGHADSQTVHGKVVSGVAKRCAAHGVACVAIVGGMDPTASEALADAGVRAIVPTVYDAMPLDRALKEAETGYRLAARRLFSLVGIGMGLGGEADD